MKRSILTLMMLLFVMWLPTLSQQTLYDMNTIQRIEITFAQPNWDYLLDTAKLGDDGYTMAEKVVINGVAFDSVGVKYKGNSSFDSTYRKNPFNISLDEFKSQNYQGIKSIKLANCFADPSMIREVLSYHIVRNYMAAPRANYAQVTVNGVQIGLYANTESINKQFCSDHFYSSNKTFISCSPMVVPTPQTKSNLRYLGADSTLYYPNYELKSSAGWNEMVALCDSITNNPSSFPAVMNADRTIWMLALNMALANLDSYSGVFCQNYYLYRDATGRFNPIMWDFNMSFGGFPFAGNSNTSMGSLTVQGIQQLSPTVHATDKYWPLINIVMGTPRYRRQFFAHLRTIVSEMYESGKYLEAAQSLRSLILDAVTDDGNKFFTDEQFTNSLTHNISVGNYQAPGIQTLVEARMQYLKSLSEYTATAPEITPISPVSAPKGSEVQLTVRVHNSTVSGVYTGVRFAKDEKFMQVPMYDDGTNGDAVAGDDVFTGNITMTSLSAEYYFYAENDSAGVFSPARAEHDFYTIQAAITSVQKGDVVINEFLASNVEGATDERGEHEDWIELYNTTNSPVDLHGTYLSDKSTALQKFTFPEQSIVPAKGYLVLWADEDPTTDEYIHANFKLSNDGEQLLFSAVDGTILDSISFGAQLSDISLGRCPDGKGAFTEIVKPTFGRTNSCITAVDETTNGDMSFTVSPNPATSALNIAVNNSSAQVFTLRNQLGETVYRSTTHGSTRISVDAYPTGIYVLSNGYWRCLIMIVK